MAATLLEHYSCTSSFIITVSSYGSTTQGTRTTGEGVVDKSWCCCTRIEGNKNKTRKMLETTG